MTDHKRDLDTAEDRWQREHGYKSTIADWTAVIALFALILSGVVSAIATLQWMAGVFAN